jgi:WD40 repeat protein
MFNKVFPVWLSLLAFLPAAGKGPATEARTTFKAHAGPVQSVAFSPDGKALATGGADGVKLWDAEGKERAAFRGRGAAVFSPDGKVLATGADRAVKLWEVATGKERATLEWKPEFAFRLAFDPAGKTLAVGRYGVKLWDTAAGKEVAALKGRHKFQICSVAFSPDGKALASADGEGVVVLWDVAGRKPRAVYHQGKKTGTVWSVAFAPDGKTLALGCGHSLVVLLDASTCKERAVLKGHGAGVQSVAFSKDGKALASGGDRTVRLWDVATGGEKAVLEGHADSVTCVAFRPDGKALASGSMDGVVKLWDVAKWVEQKAEK